MKTKWKYMGVSHTLFCHVCIANWWPETGKLAKIRQKYMYYGLRFRQTVQYVAPGPDEKDANVYFLPQKNSSELKFVLQFTVTFP